MNKKKAGVVSLFGETNVGKSTFVNCAIGEMVSVVTPKPQTTRKLIKGIYNDDRGQIVFVDTPGLHKPMGNLGKIMIKKAYESLKGIDLLLIFFDATRDVEMDKKTISEIEKEKVTKLVILNKIDLIKNKNDLLPKIAKIDEMFKGIEVFPISSLLHEDVKKVMDRIFELLPFGEPLYDIELYTDSLAREIAAEVIRKHLFLNLKQEVPYKIAVIVDEFKEAENEKGITRILATILVDKKSHKPIVIGKGGSMIKKIGIASRMELEDIFGYRIDLRLFVKVKPDWDEDPHILKELGLV